MAESKAGPPRRPPGRPQGRPLRQATIEKAALHHLERFASSVEGLRQVLLRRVEKAARDGRCDRAEAAGWVEAVVARFAAAGLVDDRVFAEARAASLRRRGDSARRIALVLRQKGVDTDLAAAALAVEDGEDRGDAEFRAACRLARRRRLGPMRPAADREARRDRDLASLARAGFALGVARRVLDLGDPEALEAAIAGDEAD
jgi:regulatory protein